MKLIFKHNEEVIKEFECNPNWKLIGGSFVNVDLIRLPIGKKLRKVTSVWLASGSYKEELRLKIFEAGEACEAAFEPCDLKIHLEQS